MLPVLRRKVPTGIGDRNVETMTITTYFINLPTLPTKAATGGHGPENSAATGAPGGPGDSDPNVKNGDGGEADADDLATNKGQKTLTGRRQIDARNPSEPLDGLSEDLSEHSDNEFSDQIDNTAPVAPQPEDKTTFVLRSGRRKRALSSTAGEGSQMATNLQLGRRRKAGCVAFSLSVLRVMMLQR
ncbi:hypothetical protein AtubIFM57258_002351 [Aspergillus tubingensis]|nr:hypothetical protein AtubIFM57258_002351 [Aspergillus tubingensis]